ncbi:hypothetical protein NEOLEDRAFT_1237946 [Neolentinus lepideus HHB14362 ss-1]|uniref:CN hydrolase domain-containing protein n=1 Tax=Neolentinus lepideus HHB14362 ss-1 TaxID=1314782 RepID=A0A165W6G8_9AGAM|nr:hypothetical protein NEOLEDRAFT_1237946 [Neolentinus lepideus HHB14362 ss-1]
MTNLKETVFISHPSISFVGVSFVLCLLAVAPRPSFFPLVLLLSSLQLYGRIIAHRNNAFVNFRNLWLALTSAVTLSHIGPALTALSTPSTSIIFLTLCAATASLIVLTAIFIDIKACAKMKSQWSQITLFPALWASVWVVIARISPVGRLATWSPVRGLPPDIWITRWFGVPAIDWLTAACSVVITEVVGDWFIGSAPARLNGDDADSIIIPDLPGVPAPKAKSPTPRSYYVLALFGLLLTVTIPHYVSSTLPLPPYSKGTTPLTVACVLPPFQRLKNGPPLLDDFIQESRRLNQAKVLLWPEGAVRFDSFDAKAAAIERVRKDVAFTNHFVGMSFEEVLPSNGSKTERRNGFVLVDKHGPVMEYYKRHLVPVAESFSLSPSTDPPTIFTLPLTMPKGFTRSEWGNETRPIPVTASICLDFTDPYAFDSLPSKPALILAPARTWDISVGLSMFEQAKARAAEIDSMVLWCDGGEGGVSGIVGRGVNEMMKAGPGSWTRTIGIQYPFDDRKTIFMDGGESVGLMIMWAFQGVIWAGGVLSTWRKARRVNEEAGPLLG